MTHTVRLVGRYQLHAAEGRRGRRRAHETFEQAEAAARRLSQSTDQTIVIAQEVARVVPNG
ncbi:MAG TPA: hypothetical protein VM662_00515 [Sphingomonas sp.]|nr:hypothetical protein [Sphingomonas sp.]